jgi:hypothetical protein
MEFYDIWVARDSDGNLFLKETPYVTDPYSLDRIARGLPFPVKCCWNGLVVLNSAPFLRHNVRVRCAAKLLYDWVAPFCAPEHSAWDLPVAWLHCGLVCTSCCGCASSAVSRVQSLQGTCYFWVFLHDVKCQ